MALNIPTEGTRLNELKINIVDTQETFVAMQTANKVNANELYFIEQELPIAADSLKTGHTFKVNLASENASTAFNGTADITDIGVSGTLPITHGGTGATSAASAPWVQKSGDTMTGVLTMKGNMYNDAYDGALNMNNSDIYGLNSIYTGDTSDGAAEGIHFYRDATHVDTFWVSGGDLLFVPNRAIGTNTTKANSQKISRFTANPTSGQVVVTDGTTGGVKSSGYTIAKSVPSNAVFTDTTYSAGTGISLSGTTFSNSGVRATTINGNYLRVNTNGTNADLTIPYATKAEQDVNGFIIPSTYVKLVAGTSIPASSTSHADLNAIDWQKTGSYCVSLNANIPYVDNLPSDYSTTLGGDQAFMMNVYSPLSSDGTTTSGNWLYRIQEIIPYSNHIYRWRRLNYTNGSGTWVFGNWTRQVLSDNNTITTVTTSGNGNAITAISATNGIITATKETTFLTSHQDISGKVNKSGDTMTGQLKTSFHSSVAMGSYNASATTIPDMIEEVRFSSGCAGSFNLTTAYTLNNITVPTGWYNFLYIPHRSGGINGAVSGDNCNYGILYIHHMTAPSSGDFRISFANSNINLARMDAQFTTAPTKDQVLIASDTAGGIKTSGYTIGKSVPTNAIFTDTNNAVTQTNQTGANDYRILLSGQANDTTATEGANKSTNLRFNPSTKILSVGGSISATGDLTVTGNTNLNGETYTESVTAGSLLVNGNTNFVQIPTAPTPAITSNDTSIATTAFVKNNLGGLSGAMHFKGTTTTALNDGTTTAAVTIGGNSYTPSAGDVVLYSDSEFVWTGSAWERLGRDSSFKVQQSAVTTATAETTTATTFVHSVTQDANGVITVKTRPLPTYNNYSLPLAASGTRGGIQIGYTQSGQNYPVQLSNEKAYVNVPWTDTTYPNAMQVYNRTSIGTSPNFDNPGINGFFEIRNSTETTGETGTRPFNGFASFLTMKTPDNIAMLQLAGGNTVGWYIRGKQSANVTLSGVEWDRLVTNSGTWAISITGNAATATSATKLATSRTIQIDLASTSSASFDGSSNITPGISGTLSVSHGGTGATTFTSGAALIGNGTGAIQTRTIKNNTSVGNLGWTSASADTALITTNTVAYWNGAYTNTSSNLQYSKNGEIMGLSSAQTVSGTKTFSAIQKFTNTTDSGHSKDTAAALSTSGGISVEKQISAKSIRIDNNQTSAGVQLIFDNTLQALNFVFA